MKIETRVEYINGVYYCAYCGKAIHNTAVGIYPPPIHSCNCTDAELEKQLYRRIEEMYKKPLCDSLIELKVDEFRNSLRKASTPYSASGYTVLNDTRAVSTAAVATNPEECSNVVSVE